MQTANGAAPAYKVKLDTVRVGDITLNNIDAMVLEGGLTTPLLGMTLPEPYRDAARRRDDGADQALLIFTLRGRIPS